MVYNLIKILIHVGISKFIHDISRKEIYIQELQ